MAAREALAFRVGAEVTKTAEFGQPCRAPLPGTCRICGYGETGVSPVCRIKGWADDAKTLCTEPECIAAARAEIGYKGFPREPLDIEKPYTGKRYGFAPGKLASLKEEQKANDPSVLKAEVARLTRELAAVQRKVAAPPKPEIIHANAEEIDRAREEGRAAGYQLAIDQASMAVIALSNGKAPQRPVQRVLAPAAPRQAPAAVVAADGLTGPQQRILNAVAWWGAFGIEKPTNEQVAFIAGYSPGSGGFNNLKGGLRSSGLIDYPEPGRLKLTEAGEGKANAPTVSPTREAFHDAVRAKLSGPQWRVLEPAISAYPDSIASDQVAQTAGYSAGSGGFNNLRGSLRTLTLIDYPAPGMVRAGDWLFP